MQQRVPFILNIYESARFVVIVVEKKKFLSGALLGDLKSALPFRAAINFAERDERAGVCIEYVDAFSQAAQDVREMGVQTEEYKDNDAYDRRSNVDSPSSRYYETSDSASMSESESGVNSDPEVCERSHKGVIIQKDSEIIVLKNELGVRNRGVDSIETTLRPQWIRSTLYSVRFSDEGRRAGGGAGTEQALANVAKGEGRGFEHAEA